MSVRTRFIASSCAAAREWDNGSYSPCFAPIRCSRQRQCHSQTCIARFWLAAEPTEAKSSAARLRQPQPWNTSPMLLYGRDLSRHQPDLCSEGTRAYAALFRAVPTRCSLREHKLQGCSLLHSCSKKSGLHCCKPPFLAWDKGACPLVSRAGLFLQQLLNQFLEFINLLFQFVFLGF